MQCETITKRGERCRNRAVTGRSCCHQHSRNTSRVELEPPPTTPELMQSLAGVFSGLAGGTASSLLGGLNLSGSSVTGSAGGDNPLATLAAALTAAAKIPPQKSKARTADDSSETAKARRARERGPLAQTVYKSAYGVGYGVAFPTFLLLSLLPDNALGDGLRDGAKNAYDTVRMMRKKKTRHSRAG